MSVPTDSPPTYDISVAGTQPDSPSSRYPLRNLAPLLVPLLLAPLSLLLLTTLGAAPGSPDMSAFFSFLKVSLPLRPPLLGEKENTWRQSLTSPIWHSHPTRCHPISEREPHPHITLRRLILIPGVNVPQASLCLLAVAGSYAHRHSKSTRLIYPRAPSVQRSDSQSDKQANK